MAMKSFTDIEQSKKLAEILPQESADMYYFLDPTPSGNIYHLTVQRVDVGIKNLPQYDEGDIPCWSLAALLNYLRSKSILEIEIAESFRIETDYYNDEEDKAIHPMHSIMYESTDFVDACVEMMVTLKEKGLL